MNNSSGRSSISRNRSRNHFQRASSSGSSTASSSSSMEGEVGTGVGGADQYPAICGYKQYCLFNLGLFPN